LSGLSAGQECRGGDRLAAGAALTSLRASGIEVGAHGDEYRFEHRRRQDAGVGVVARAVIAREQSDPANIARSAVREWDRRALLTERHDRALVRDPAERHDG